VLLLGASQIAHYPYGHTDMFSAIGMIILPGKNRTQPSQCNPSAMHHHSGREPLARQSSVLALSLSLPVACRGRAACVRPSGRPAASFLPLGNDALDLTLRPSHTPNCVIISLKLARPHMAMSYGTWYTSTYSMYVLALAVRSVRIARIGNTTLIRASLANCLITAQY
jgi:hypothetical protein